jgi:biopolymer transport protein ExbB
MVELFESFTSSGASVEAFARGISIALYNTAGGIVVAVPAMIFYRYFKSNISNKILLMENQASEILNIIKK